MKRTGTAVLAITAVALLGALVSAAPASAQLKLGGFNLEGDIEAGGRAFINEPTHDKKGKLEEYRDIPNGLFLDSLRLRLFRPDESYSVTLGGAKWSQEDQEFSLGVGRLGLWEFKFDWDQTPHVYSTTGRSLATESSKGVFTLPDPRVPLSAHNDAPRLDTIGQRWDTARFSLTLTPSPDLDVRVDYTRIEKNGDRPFSLVFGTPGNNFYEFAAPVDHQIQDFRVRAAYAREGWQLQAGYTFSMFNNSYQSFTVDNPCRGTATTTIGGCGSTDTGTSAIPRGRISVEPDNMAHTFNLAGGVNLPMRTRVTANLAYSLRIQNESLLPQTITPLGTAAGTTPGLTESTTSTSAAERQRLLGLPKEVFDGLIATTLFNFNVTSRPLRPLTLTLKYRLFDFDDKSDELLFPANVENDRVFRIDPRVTRRWDYTRHNADVDARYQLFKGLSTTVGGGWERWNRVDHREVQESNEYSLKAAVDWIPRDWIQTRLTYRPSVRRNRAYETLAHAAHITQEDLTTAEVAAAQSPFLRKFDEGERDRQRLDALVQFFPTETLTTTFNAGYMNDDYKGGRYGLRDVTTWTAGMDVNWTPAERVSFSANYVRELIFQGQRSRVRTSTSDNPADEWISNSIDTVDTLSLGANVAVIPRVLDWLANGSVSYAIGRVENRNVNPPPTQANAFAHSWPAFEDTLIRLDTAVQYHFLKNWTATLGYTFEAFEKNDWRTDEAQPFIITGATFLGNKEKNYDAHIVGVKLGYRF